MTPIHLLHTALEHVAQHGLDDLVLGDVADAAGMPLAEVAKHFPSKESVAMVFYGRVAERFTAAAPDLPKGSIAERFVAAMQIKLRLINPHRNALRKLAQRALDPSDRLGILGPRTATIRSQNSAVFSLVVSGATDAPPAAEQARLGRLLYGAHLAVLGAWTQDLDDENPKAQGSLQLVRTALGMLPMLTFLPNGGDILDNIDGIFGDVLANSAGQETADKVDWIVGRIFERRRLLSPTERPPSQAAMALHRPLVHKAVAANEPVHLVLPAFPAKSPNPSKTIGKLPDLAEVIALRSLQELADQIQQAHPPGAIITIASDGHVFSDLVEVADQDIDAYQDAIKDIIETEALTALRLFDLRHVFGSDAAGFLQGEAARTALNERYATPIDDLKKRADQHPRHQAMADGIHRFLFEDAVVLHPDISRSQNRKRTKETSWKTIQRSEAWGALVAEMFPDALRLSIHPQPEVSHKIGLHLLPTEDAWLTPWHGVALIQKTGVKLVKRSEAEALGATMKDDHFVL